MKDISLNIMSLGGLALGVGMLVDNSIVVLESILRCREEGDDPLDAANRGTHEVAAAVTSSTLTSIAVFFPITFVQGIAGQMFGNLALTVTFSLLASLAVALFLNPMMVARNRAVQQHRTDVIWMLRAYRESRAHGHGLFGSFVRIAPHSVKYSWIWFLETIADTFGPLAQTLIELKTAPSFKGMIKTVFSLLFLPLLLLLFILQLLLKVIGAGFATAFFFVCLIVYVLVYVIGKILKVILWLPLTLFDMFYRLIRMIYDVSIRYSLRFGPVVLLLVVALALHAGYMTSFIGSQLIPALRQGEFGIRMQAPPGTRLEETERIAQTVEKVILETPQVDTVTIEIGAEKTKTRGDSGENIATFTVLLKNPDQTARIQDSIINDLTRAYPRRVLRDHHLHAARALQF